MTNGRKKRSGETGFAGMNFRSILRPAKRGAGFSHRGQPRNRTRKALRARSDRSAAAPILLTSSFVINDEDNKTEDCNEKPNTAVRRAVRPVRPGPNAGDSDDRLCGDRDGTAGDGGDSGRRSGPQWRARGQCESDGQG